MKWQNLHLKRNKVTKYIYDLSSKSVSWSGGGGGEVTFHLLR